MIAMRQQSTHAMTDIFKLLEFLYHPIQVFSTTTSLHSIRNFT